MGMAVEAANRDDGDGAAGSTSGEKGAVFTLVFPAALIVRHPPEPAI